MNWRLLQRDIKSTRLKELEMEKDTYYHEVMRLQSLTEKMTTELNDEIPNTKKELKMRVDILNESMVKMRERLEEIDEENKRFEEETRKERHWITWRNRLDNNILLFMVMYRLSQAGIRGLSILLACVVKKTCLTIQKVPH